MLKYKYFAQAPNFITITIGSLTLFWVASKYDSRK